MVVVEIFYVDMALAEPASGPLDGLKPQQPKEELATRGHSESKISPGKAGGFKDVSRSKRLGGDADAAPKLEPPEGGFFDRGRRRTN